VWGRSREGGVVRETERERALMERVRREGVRRMQMRESAVHLCF
jgi:hypothetical protein